MRKKSISIKHVVLMTIAMSISVGLCVHIVRGTAQENETRMQNYRNGSEWPWR